MKNKKFKFNLNIKDLVNYGLVLALLSYGYYLYYNGALVMSTAKLLEQIGYSIILAVSLNFVVGFLGELSLGHAGFMCVGAYIGGFVGIMVKEQMPEPEMKIVVLIIAMLAGGLVSALFGLLIGIPSLRLKGDYLAIVTLAFGEIVRVIFRNQEMFGGNLGLDTKVLKYNTRQEPTLFIVIFVVALIMLFFIQNLVRSKHGRAITAIRDNEIAAKSMGINVIFYKLLVFVTSAFFAGCAGAIFSHIVGLVENGQFDYNYSIEILVIVVLGGMGNITGSIIAATFITYINTTLMAQFSGDAAAMKNVIYALILIVVVVLGNAPALKHIREKLNIGEHIRRLTNRKGNAQKRKSDEAKWSRVPTKIKMDALLSTDMNPNSNQSIHGDISANDKGGNK